MPCGSGRFDTLHVATSGGYQDFMSRGANHRGSYPNLSTLVIHLLLDSLSGGATMHEDPIAAYPHLV